MPRLANGGDPHPPRPVQQRATRWLRALMPRAWRHWLFDPSVAEATATAIAGGRAHAGLSAVVGLWLQSWWVGLRRLFARPFATRALPSDPESAMHSLVQDLRYAVRSLAASPGFCAVAVLTLALGAGVNTAIFGVVDFMMFRPLAGTQDGDELAYVMSTDPQTPFLLGVSYPVYEALVESDSGFDDVLLYSWRPTSLGGGDGAAQRIFAYVTSANFFDLQGVVMAAGRGFLPEDGRPDTPAAAVVLTHDFWQTRFDGADSTLGSTIELNGLPFTVIGITPPEYLGVESMLAPEIYLPLGALIAFNENTTTFQSVRSRGFRALGRLAPSATLESAQAAVDRIAEALRAQFPEELSDFGFSVLPERAGRPDPTAGDQFGRIAAIFGALVGMVLLIACANVANLMLARATARDREVAIRSALGAGRLRVMRQLGLESLLLGIAGGVVGVVIAFWATGTLRAVVDGWQIEIPVRLPIHVDLRAVMFGTAVAALAGLAAGVLPAFQATRGDLTSTLRDGARGSSGGAGRQRTRSLLVAAQVAVSLVLLIAAGLFMRSLQAATRDGLGFETAGRLHVSFDPSVVGWSVEQGRALHEELLDGVRALPGVRQAGIVNAPPFSPRLAMVSTVAEADYVPDGARGEFTVVSMMSPGLLEASGTRLLQGRDVSNRDTPDTPFVAIVNETMAARMWPGQNALGQRFVSTGTARTYEVIGVVETGKYQLIWEEPSAAFFVPTTQVYPGAGTLVVHADGDPLQQADGVRRLFAAAAPTVPVFGIMTVDAYLRDGRALMLVRLASGLVTAFGLLGVALATVGLYGVIAYSVGQRMREFGVRVALGADRRAVVSLVVRQAAGMALAGIGVGFLLSIGLGRALASLLIGVSPNDPLTFALAATLVLATAALAALVPARRATRIDPINAMRDE